jgi:two-component system cell cycle response regulator
VTVTDPPKILVVDDDQALLQTLSVILRGRGYDVVPVSNGRDLMRRLVEERPDLLMLDIMMPKVDGLQLLQQIKRDDRWRDLPVLMLSSMTPEEGTVRSLGLGASDFIAKPFRVKELTARIDAHLRTGMALRQARREAQARASEAATRAEMVDLLHEVTDALAPEEIYHILTRRVARVLKISRCSMVLARKGDVVGTVVMAAENPMLRNLEIRLDRYPEIRQALETNQPILVPDVHTDPLYTDVRRYWDEQGIHVSTRSVIAVPFGLREEQSGVFFLRTLGDEPPLTTVDLEFASKVVQTAISAIEKAYALQVAESDKVRYQWLATTDALTGCLNRRALFERLQQEFERLRRYDFELTLLMIDLDRFKDVNDRFGHLVGDRVLQQLGDLLRRQVRSVDAVARYGGEEFAVVLPETDEQGGVIFAERIRQAVAAHDFADTGEPLRLTVSVGVAHTSRDVDTPERLIDVADRALYRAKNEGRNLVRT